MPATLATWEAEIVRSHLEASPGKKLARPNLKEQAGYGGLCL
jgi:hypothetical protein